MERVNRESNGRQAVSVDEAARQLGVGRSLAWKLVNDGRLRTIRAGHRVLVPIQAISEFLEGKTHEAEPGIND